MEYTFRNKKAQDFPEMVHVDISTVCNFKCIHCPQGDPEKWADSSRTMMKKESFHKIVDEASSHNVTLRITTDGEPFLHPDIEEFLSYTLNSDLYAATITTNGSLLKPELINLIMKPSKVRFVIDFSIDAIYRKTYEEIRRGGNYLAVLKNIFSLVEARNRKKANHVYVMVNAIQQPNISNEEIQIFKTFWEQIVDRVIIRKYVDVHGLVGKLSGSMASSPPERWPCVLLWSRIMINPKGEIRFCIDDWNNESVFTGKTIDNTNIAEIWQSSEYQCLREDHLDRRFSHKFCRTCRNWEGLRWDYDYRTALDALFSEG